MRPAALNCVSMKHIVSRPLFDLHSGGILAIDGVTSGRSRSGVSVGRGQLGEMVRDVLLGLIRDVGVVKSSLEAGSAEARQQ